MRFYLSTGNDPTFNLAMEEYLFGREGEDFLFIYINSPSVICGKHQNAVAESNSAFLSAENIPLIRRFSGGGTVYHDGGNLNFSFICSHEAGKVIQFAHYARPVVDFLRSLGIKALLNQRNDIEVGGLKVSGHAAHARKLRAVHHGTLLYDANLQFLSASLRSSPSKFHSRAVKSVRSPVANLRNFLNRDLDVNEFTEMLSEHLLKSFNAGGTFSPDSGALQMVEKLAAEKYGNFSWNYGYSPEYRFEVSFPKERTEGLFRFGVKEGIISEIERLENGEPGVLRELLGCRHYLPDLKRRMKEIFGGGEHELAELFF